MSLCFETLFSYILNFGQAVIRISYRMSIDKQKIDVPFPK